MDREQLQILSAGSGVWNDWRRQNLDVPIDLRRARLRGLDLSGAALNECSLRGSDFTGADLSGADLRYSDLSHCKFAGTRLTRAQLDWANLTDASADVGPAPWLVERVNARSGRVTPQWRADDFPSAPTTFDLASMRYCRMRTAKCRATTFRDATLRGAFVEGTTFDEADFEGADLGQAEFAYAVFRRTNIHRARNLAVTFHTAPSEIDFRTLRNASGQLPPQFLRGVGFSELEIEYSRLYDGHLANDDVITLLYRMADLRGYTPIQSRSIFISYAHADSAFVDTLETALDSAGFKCWRDVHGFVAGRIEKQIDRAISLNEIVLLVLSENSVKSDWVEWEVARARAQEKQLRRDVLCPITLDDTWREADWSGPLFQQVRDYHILDFHDWLSGSRFEAQVERLVHGLRTFYRAVE